MILKIILLCILGTVFNFTYQFSNQNKIVGLFSSVNESTWEHIKTALSAIFLYSIFEFNLFQYNPNYFIALGISIIIVIVLIPIIFYTYTYFTKKPILIIDILSYYITIVCSQLIFNYILNNQSFNFIYSQLSIILLVLIFCFYMIATICPPKIFLFIDPRNKKYGFDAFK